eukprot:2843623-Alexandrium_andersonii.AAC.1
MRGEVTAEDPPADREEAQLLHARGPQLHKDSGIDLFQLGAGRVFGGEGAPEVWTDSVDALLLAIAVAVELRLPLP